MLIPETVFSPAFKLLFDLIIVPCHMKKRLEIKLMDYFEEPLIALTRLISPNSFALVTK